jgi:hypothetical protein
MLGNVVFLHWGSGKRSNRSEESLVIRIPHCKECAKEHRIEPDAIDLEHYQVALIVHRDFAEQIR